MDKTLQQQINKLRSRIHEGINQAELALNAFINIDDELTYLEVDLEHFCSEELEEDKNE